MIFLCMHHSSSCSRSSVRVPSTPAVRLFTARGTSAVCSTASVPSTYTRICTAATPTSSRRLHSSFSLPPTDQRCRRNICTSADYSHSRGKAKSESYSSLVDHRLFVSTMAVRLDYSLRHLWSVTDDLTDFELCGTFYILIL